MKPYGEVSMVHICYAITLVGSVSVYVYSIVTAEPTYVLVYFVTVTGSVKT